MPAPVRHATDPMTSSEAGVDFALDLLCHHAPARGVLVDLPCGVGTLSVRAQARGWSVRPYDLEPEGWRATPRLAVGRADLNAPLPLPDASAQALACLEGIEHVENPWLVLREFARVLVPGGWLLLSLPNTIDLRQRFRMLRRGYWGHYPPEVPYHINAMGPFLLCHALLRTGFAVRDIRARKRYGGPVAWVLARLLGYRRACGLPEAVRAMLSRQEVLRGRTVVLLAQRSAEDAAG